MPSKRRKRFGGMYFGVKVWKGWKKLSKVCWESGATSPPHRVTYRPNDSLSFSPYTYPLYNDHPISCVCVVLIPEARIIFPYVNINKRGLKLLSSDTKSMNVLGSWNPRSFGGADFTTVKETEYHLQWFPTRTISHPSLNGILNVAHN